MNDDFNSPVLIAQLFEGVKIINAVKEEKQTLTQQAIETLKNTMNAFVFDVLGLKDNDEECTTDNKALTHAVNLLIEMRNKARADKDFATGDKIRDELLAAGIQLKDGKDGTTFSVL